MGRFAMFYVKSVVMEYPKRSLQHISETGSATIFKDHIPKHWIVRELSERDYGIDYYLEIVNEKKELTGDLALIQLKSRNPITWNSEGHFTLSGIEISSSNYWYSFPVPVFIFLADNTNNDLYFKLINSFIRREFFQYNLQKSFSYKFIRDSDKFDVFSFKKEFNSENDRQQFENELFYFISNIKQFQDFQAQHYHRDSFLPIEISDLIFFETMHRNFSFLCNYFNISNLLPDLLVLKKQSLAQYDHNQLNFQLYEDDLTRLAQPIKSSIINLILAIKNLLTEERAYWESINPNVYNYVIRITNEGELPDFY